MRFARGSTTVSRRGRQNSLPDHGKQADVVAVREPGNDLVRGLVRDQERADPGRITAETLQPACFALLAQYPAIGSTPTTVQRPRSSARLAERTGETGRVCGGAAEATAGRAPARRRSLGYSIRARAHSAGRVGCSAPSPRRSPCPGCRGHPRLHAARACGVSAAPPHAEDPRYCVLPAERDERGTPTAGPRSKRSSCGAARAGSRQNARALRRLLTRCANSSLDRRVVSAR